ncbi:MAG: xanthan lyase [Bacteroidaceae bacterium]|nr:xanthan lyase [Bacteroidaceae bacterium]
MIRHFLAILFCLFGISVLSAQSVDKTVSRALSEYFRNYTSDRTLLKFSALDRRKNNIVVNNKAKKIIIYSNEAFAGQAFTPAVVDKIYKDIRGILPKNLRKYKIEVVYKGRSIEQRVPNIYRSAAKVDKSRLWGGVVYNGSPWVRNISRPFAVTGGLDGRHIALWQSHGRYYFADGDFWKWQRPSLYCTTEDLLTQSIVVPFLMPMLENAGALVYTPRERDWQPECVIVDNDKSTPGGSRYSESEARGSEWETHIGGYAPLKDFYCDLDDPFSMGTSRSISAVQNKKKLSTAVWSPEIPVPGEYAVYVAYRTFENSVPDALYTVRHSGGETSFKVNQTMGGGTWVYLGTFFFDVDEDKRQGVVLANYSSHDGVVSADAVRFGGGVGNVARGPGGQLSGLPRYLEGARYNLQTGGFPYEVYSPFEGEADYRDDIVCRPSAVNYLSGGSVFNPDTIGLNVPLELSFGFHSDAGVSAEDNVIGSLGVVTTEFNGDTLATGHSRQMSRDLVSFLLNSVQDDLTARYGKRWPVRGILDRNYGETRVPYIPSVIFESLSHQNFMDMVYAHDPDFKFTLARSVYKVLLKHLCYVRGRDYVVQPLPVSHFAMSMSGDDNEVVLSWRPVNDVLEPTAKPKGYILYRSVDGSGFDNGTVVNEAHCSIPVEKGVMYSFKVAAFNDGGCSLPSEELSLYIANNEKGRALVVNGFHRLSGPDTLFTDKRIGFDFERDPGVPYMRTPEYCGGQLDFMRENLNYENGLGLSGSECEGMLVAGNTLNYPRIHGEALAVNDISFLSCGSEAVIDGVVDMQEYDVVDLILGVEKQGGKGSLLHYNSPYKAFPAGLQGKLTEYCHGGGRLFVSGAFIASDMQGCEADRLFVRNLLHFDYGGTVSNLSEDVVTGSGLRMSIERKANESCYAVSRPDILVPLDDAFVSFVFDGCKESAGVAYSGNGYRTLSTSFPFEAVQNSVHRTKLMGAVMRFLLK